MKVVITARHGDLAQTWTPQNCRSSQAGMDAGALLLAEGDGDGAVTWQAIIRAIDQLQRARREDEPVQ